MFNIKKQQNIVKRILQIGNFRYSCSSYATINKNNSDFETNIPREVNYISLQNTYISLQFNVTHNVAANTQYANNNATFLLSLGPNALFSEAKFTTISNKHLENAENCH